MRRQNVVTTVIAILLLLSYLLFNFLPNLYWRLIEFSDVNIGEKLKSEWISKPKSFLIGKLRANVHVFNYTAGELLISRKDLDITNEMIEIIKNDKNKGLQKSAIYILTMRGDNNVVPTLMDIVKSNTPGDLYIDSLQGLARLKYEPAFPYIISLAVSKPEDKLYEDRVYAIRMLENFNKEESITTLEKIARDDPEDYIRYQAERAIKQIREKIN